MPVEFRFPVAGTTIGTAFEIWTYLDPSRAQEDNSLAVYFAYARRKPGVSLEQAQADVSRVAAGIARNDPARHPMYTAVVVGLQGHTLNDLRPTLLVLFAAAGVLLLIACANVATLLLTRSVARARETAVRVALGAGRGHLALRYLAEGALVSLIGAAAGVALSVVLVRAIAVAGSSYIPDANEIAIDWNVVGFGLAMALVASALASLAPLWQAVRTPPNAVLTEGVRASAAGPVRKVSQTLVVAEIALAFTLLTVAVVLAVHLRNLNRVATGLDPTGVLTFEIAAPSGLITSNALAPFQRRLIESLESIPTVTSATIVNHLPFDGCCIGGTVYAEGLPPGEEGRRVSFVFTTPGFLASMGIPLRAGRFLTEADTREDLLSIVVNETAARRYWPNRNPVGAFGRLSGPDGDRFQVLGVVGDVLNDGLNKATEAEIYLLTTITPINPMSVVVRSSLSLAQMIPEVRRAVQMVDPTLAIHDVRLMTDMIRESLQLERVSSLVMLLFALAALLLATLGIYGVVSYSVRQRTVEMGTRMALGAVGRDLLRLVIGGGLRMAALGIAVGTVALAGSVWLLARVLEVRDISWPPFLFSTGIVAIITATASYVPAWRASLLSPMVAIRDESASAWQSMRLRFLRAVRDVRHAATTGASAQTAPTLLTEFVAAARAADSFDDALRNALSTLSIRLGVDSAALLEKAVDQAYRSRIAIGAFEAIEWIVPAEGFLARRLMAYPLPLPFDESELESLTEWAAANRPERLEEIRRLARSGVRMAVPLRTRAEIMGILLLGPSRDRGSFGAADRQVLRSCADQFALMMENARLTDRVVGQEALRRDLALAAEVQKRLLPSAPPSAEIAEFAAVSVPARTIGGDYYDFIQVGDQRLGIALADVSGKGVAAALIMSVVQASLRIIASDGDISLPRLAARMNEFLYRSTPGNKYATFFYAQVDGERRQLRYVNAGHNPPYLVRGRTTAAPDESSPVEELTIGGAVVGMLPGMSYEEATVDLCPGDVLLAYTDGVTEAHNPDNVEFGEDKLKALLSEVAHLSVDEIRERLAAELKAWIKDAEQYDDLTFVVMKVH
jgi:predicted permease